MTAEIQASSQAVACRKWHSQYGKRLASVGLLLSEVP